jgi:hypothetical protein
VAPAIGKSPGSRYGNWREWTAMPSGWLFSYTGLNMKSIRAYLATAIVALFAITFVALTPAFAVDIPDDDDQDILIRTTLMTFNDANMTGNYSVFMTKASKEFQSQFSAEKMAAALESFSKNKLDLGDVITADYDSYEKAKFDGNALVLVGVFKTDDLEVKYNLRFLQNEDVWKVSSINVDATRAKH